MMHYIQLNAEGFADESGYLRCHLFHPETKEYLGESEEYISQHTGLPAWAFIDGPDGPAPQGMVWVRTEQASCSAVENYRGETVYDKTTRAPMEITELGPVPDTHTLVAPTSQFDIWNEQTQTWTVDEAAEKRAQLESSQAEQSKRIADANQQIATLKPAVDGGYAKLWHDQLLSDWQRYRYELALVPECPGWPELPQWPEKPESAV